MEEETEVKRKKELKKPNKVKEKPKNNKSKLSEPFCNIRDFVMMMILPTFLLCPA